MFGFRFDENFDHPYCAKTVSEFWRRWHISLGTWFRDYVYVPMGGSRVKSKLRLLLNLFTVWILTGVWHGASWSFVLWGAMYFVLIAFEKLTGIPKKIKGIPSVFYRIFTLFCIQMGWVLFRAEGLRRGSAYLISMFTPHDGSVDLFTARTITDYIPYLVTALILCLPVAKLLERGAQRIKSDKVRTVLYHADRVWIIVLFLISLSYAVSSTFDPFIYFNF
jgi:D-alanyl-lipoteichoic acid acyltransferase DltB (MBOAT superfamily)